MLWCFCCFSMNQAPLSTGVLDGHRLKCPWHGACFNVTTGDIEDAPALSALPTYPVRIDNNGNIYVSAKQTEENKNSAKLPDCIGISCQKPAPLNRHFIIVGGGCAGLQAAETLRENGFQGSITIITNNNII